MDEAFNLEGYTTEVTIPEEFAAGRQDRRRGREAVARATSRCCTLMRARDRVNRAGGPAPSCAPAICSFSSGEPDALKRLIDEAKLKLVRDENTERDRRARRRHRRHGSDRHRRIRRWSTARPTQYRLYEHHQVQPARGQPQRPPHRCTGSARRGSKPGDVIVLQGNLNTHAGGARRTALPAAGAARTCRSAAAAGACCRWRCWRSRCC